MSTERDGVAGSEPRRNPSDAALPPHTKQLERIAVLGVVALNYLAGREGAEGARAAVVELHDIASDCVKAEVERLTLEQAQAVIAAHREAERQAERKKLLPLIGRYFKYRNSYSSDRPKWWLYFAVTGVSEWGPVDGWSFQQCSDGEVQVKLEDHSWVDRGGWVECTATEFAEAWAGLCGVIAAQFPNRHIPKAISRRKRSGLPLGDTK